MRVLLTHRYPMREVRRRWAAGTYPRQHLWGGDALERAGLTVAYGPFGRPGGPLRSLSFRTGERLGDLAEQPGVLARARRGDVLLAGEAGQIRGLALLRRAGRWPVPIVGIVHHVDPDAPWVDALDVVLCLSRQMRDRLLAAGRDPARVGVVPWGPDLAFSAYVPTGDELVVSAGRTDRDLATLLGALGELGAPARVYAPDAVAAPPTVELRPHGADYLEVLEDVRRAAVVAIPLRRADRVVGLTELGDALALGKPIVMTRTAAVDLDVEAVGCGIAVAPGDVRGWRDALRALLGDPARRRAMGAAGRAWVERQDPLAEFGAGVLAAVRTAIAAPVPAGTGARGA